jgi:hypothetical protein
VRSPGPRSAYTLTRVSPHDGESVLQDEPVVSVSGIATITRDRAKIHELWAPDWQLWFPKEGDERHGTKDDPRMVLIGVDVHAASFLEVNKPQPIVLFELVKGFFTGSAPELGEMHHVTTRHH